MPLIQRDIEREIEGTGSLKFGARHICKKDKKMVDGSASAEISISPDRVISLYRCQMLRPMYRNENISGTTSENFSRQ